MRPGRAPTEGAPAVAKRPTPPPLTKTERQALEDLIRRGARALNPAEGNRLLRLLELDQGDRQQERRTAGGLMAQVQQLGGQLKDMTAERDRFAAGAPLICCDERHEAKVRGLENQLAAVRALDGQEAQR